MSAHRAPHVGGYVDARKIDRDTTLDLALGAANGFAIHGTVSGAIDGDSYVQIVERDARHSGDVWTAAIRPDRTFFAIVPRFPDHLVFVRGENLIGRQWLDGSGDRAEVALAVTRPAAAPHEMVGPLRLDKRFDAVIYVASTTHGPLLRQQARGCGVLDRPAGASPCPLVPKP